MITLKVKVRDKKEKAKKIRESGGMPAVFYGKVEKSTPISIKLADFLRAWKVAGESTVITLEGDTLKKEALIHDIDMNPVTGIPRHADFYVFEKGHLLEVSVSLKFTGISQAVKELGGTLVKVLHELNIKAQPQNLPHEIEVNISGLMNFESRILAKDINLPEGVVLDEKPEEVVALVEEIEEEVEETPIAPDLSAIEVEKKGKKPEEGEVSLETPAEEQNKKS